jgi:Tfp pilus assembly protein PilX
LRRLRNEEGFALITSIIILGVMLGLGLSLLFLTDSQQKAASSEQNGESAFNVAEAALNAQIGQLSRSWPSASGSETEQPFSCTSSTSTSTNYCPTAASLTAGYPTASKLKCTATKEAWGGSLTNQWTTYVRDNENNGEKTTVYNSEAEKGDYHYDKNGDGKVFVRSVGVVGCRIVPIVALVAEQIIPIKFPTAAVAGNWFETSNKGNKTIVNTEGKESGQPGGISMRCEGKTEAECEQYREGQIVPNTTKSEKTKSPALSTTEAEELKSLAKAEGKYYAKGTCPTKLEELTGKPVWVEGPCNLSYTIGVANSASKPGFLVIQNGTFQLNGNSEFFGTIYAMNEQGSSGVVVELHGTSKLTGAIIVDGKGGIVFGSSGSGGQNNENYVYSKAASEEIKGFAGASATRNSFRILPINQ